jgi:hypothetical protein
MYLNTTFYANDLVISFYALVAEEIKILSLYIYIKCCNEMATINNPKHYKPGIFEKVSLCSENDEPEKKSKQPFIR